MTDVCCSTWPVPQAALSRAQYAIATVVTLVVFLMFYVAFLALVLAQRFEFFAPFVAPKAVFADSTGEFSSFQTRSKPVS